MLDDDAVGTSPVWRLLACLLALLVAACSAPLPPAVAPDSASGIRPLPGTTDYIGAAACGGCHRGEFEAWLGSDHDLAMQEATPATVLGDFDNVRFEHAGTTTRFSRRDGRYLVHTDGPDGRPGEFEIRYTFGHAPLQQYLIELPGGRLQAFGVAWDSRPAAAGGQRWFHLYPDRQLKAGDPLHWTGRDQNWNFMCAECHSTALAKDYDVASDSYRSHWSEIDVSCEACHGPGLAHARWASLPASERAHDPGRGLSVHFDERRGVSWLPDAGTGIARRSVPRVGRVEIDACGRCHGRASRLVGGAAHDGSLLDHHRPALLDPEQYWPDGQMRGEVFNWGPFLQSRMQQAGVTCSDCHQPHNLTLRVEGNALCAQCHAPTRFDQPAHTHHVAGSNGSQCVACHMPAVTFMQVDVRHDHAFRIPRSDLSLRLGTPDACTACHKDRNAQWAADALARWFPDSTRRTPDFAATLQDANDGAPQIARRLADLASDPVQSPIVRASALRAMTAWLNPVAARQATASLQDPDPLLRMAAVEALAQIPPEPRARLLARLLSDPVLAVRIEAAAALAGPPEAHLDAVTRMAFTTALREYESSLDENADRADAVVSRADLYLRRGQWDAAESAFRRATTLDPRYTPAWLGLAELERARGAEAAALQILETASQRLPQAAELQHALGLALVRAGLGEDARAALGRAAELAPDVPRYAYVYGVALHDGGQAARARQVLEEALERHPFEREILSSLAMYDFEDGQRGRARELAARLLEIDPSDAAARQLQQWVAQ